MFCESSRTSFLQVTDRQKGHSRHQVLLSVEKSETPSSTGEAQHLSVWRKSNHVQFHLAAGKISFVMIKFCLQLQLNGKLTLTREVTIVPQKKIHSLCPASLYPQQSQKNNLTTSTGSFLLKETLEPAEVPFHTKCISWEYTLYFLLAKKVQQCNILNVYFQQHMT